MAHGGESRVSIPSLRLKGDELNLLLSALGGQELELTAEARLDVSVSDGVSGSTSAIASTIVAIAAIAARASRLLWGRAKPDGVATACCRRERKRGPAMVRDESGRGRHCGHRGHRSDKIENAHLLPGVWSERTCVGLASAACEGLSASRLGPREHPVPKVFGYQAPKPAN